MPFSASVAGAPAEVHQHVLIQNIVLFQPCASSGSARMAPLESVPHGHCWWDRCLCPSRDITWLVVTQRFFLLMGVLNRIGLPRLGTRGCVNTDLGIRLHLARLCRILSPDGF